MRLQSPWRATGQGDALVFAATQKSGLFVEKGKRYRFSMYVRSDDYRSALDVKIEKPDARSWGGNLSTPSHAIGRSTR